MSTKTDITVLPAAPHVESALSIVTPGSALAVGLTAQGVQVDSPAGQRAVAKAVSGIARDLMEGAALLAADAGHEGARRAVACLARVRTERAIRK